MGLVGKPGDYNCPCRIPAAAPLSMPTSVAGAPSFGMRSGLDRQRRPRLLRSCASAANSAVVTLPFSASHSAPSCPRWRVVARKSDNLAQARLIIVSNGCARTKRLGAIAHDDDVIERQADAAVFEKPGFLGVAVQQGVAAFGCQHREHNAGHAGAAADVHDFVAAQIRRGGGACEHQARDHLRVGDGGQVIGAVPFLKQPQPREQRLDARGVRRKPPLRKTQLRKPGAQGRRRVHRLISSPSLGLRLRAVARCARTAVPGRPGGGAVADRRLRCS